jgi:hypothetical protein
MHACRILVGNPEGKKQLGGPKVEGANNIKMDIRELDCGGIDWIYLVQSRNQWRTLVKKVWSLIPFWEIIVQLSEWRILVK